MRFGYAPQKLNQILKTINLKSWKAISILGILAFASLLTGLAAGNALAPKSHIVSLTRDGFNPDAVVIAKGDSITWINTDTRPHWPASNSHPTHMEYQTDTKGCLGSALDACRGLKKGESFSFVFDQEGIFGMHDHLIPGDILSVEVVSRISYVFNIKKAGKSEVLADRRDFIEPKEFRTLDYSEKRLLIRSISKKDPGAAWSYLRKAAMEDGEVVDNVHEFAHAIGRESYRQSGFEGIKICSEEFAYGCYHGVTELMILNQGVRNIESECSRFWPQGQSQEFRNCIHGAGHGILTWHNLDLKKALVDCDQFGQDHQDSCYDGIFMEYASVSPESFFNEKEPWKMCLVLDQNHQPKCAKYQVDIFKQQFKAEFQETLQVCESAPALELKDFCWQGLSHQIVLESLGNYDDIQYKCSLAKSVQSYDFCIIYAAEDLAFQRYKGWQEAANNLCASTLNVESKDKCYNFISRYDAL